MPEGLRQLHWGRGSQQIDGLAQSLLPLVMQLCRLMPGSHDAGIQHCGSKHGYAPTMMPLFCRDFASGCRIVLRAPVGGRVPASD